MSVPLNPALDAALQRLIAGSDGRISISSAGRTPEQQAQIIANNWGRFNLPSADLARWQADVQQYGPTEAGNRWEQTFTNARRRSDGSPFRNWIALPGRSQHQRGMAADLRFATPEARQWAHQNAAQYGLTFPLSNESWHIELIGGRNGQPRAVAVPNSAPQQGGPQMATRGLLSPANDPLQAQAAQAQQEAQQGPRGILDRLRAGWNDPDRRAQFMMALEGMTNRPNQALIQSLGEGIQSRREQAASERAANATAQWLRSQGRDDLAQLVEAGGVQGAQAMGLAMEERQRQAAAGQAEQSRSSTVAWLRQSGREDLAAAVESGAISPSAAVEQSLAQPELTARQREFNQARGEGFEGTFLDYQRAVAESTRPQTNVNVGAGETAFQRQAGERAATRYDAMVTAGGEAAQNLSQINRLETLLSQGETGATAPLSVMAARLGFDVPGGNELAAAEAIISQLVPAQRQPGSGTMSDRDLELFQASLPRITNQPGGNALIIESIRAVNENTIRAGEIADSALRGDITQAEASAQLRALRDPLAAVRGFIGGESGGGASRQPQSQAPSGGDFASMTRQQLLDMDLGQMSAEQLQAWSQRMDEVQ